MTYSHMGTPTLPSAQLHFTSEFGMGSGGATALLSLDKKVTISKININTNSIQNTSVREVYSSLSVFIQNHLGVVWLSLTGN